MKIAISVVIIFVLAVFAAAQERFLKPTDEGPQDSSFVAFRNSLRTAVSAKDAKFIRSILDPKVRVDFGEGGGIAQFLKRWTNLDKNSDFWSEFSQVINNGGAFANDDNSSQFWAPYVYSKFPNDLEPFENAVIFGKNVNLREAPSFDAKVVANLSYNLVKADYENSIQNGDDIETLVWIKVETFGGLKGFVKAQFVRSPVDFRACFEKKDGKWKLIVFVSGD